MGASGEAELRDRDRDSQGGRKVQSGITRLDLLGHPRTTFRIKRKADLVTRRSTETSSGRQTKRVSPLWWALPIAFLVAILLLIVAGFEMCGISGCSGGGFGVAESGRGAVIPLLAVGGLAIALPLVLIHWHPRWWVLRWNTPSSAVRLTVGLVVAVTWTLVNAVRLYSQV
jgi:hypothetical protein